jgi:thioesterase domain-containing protein
MPFIVAVPHFFTQMFAARFRGERPVYGLRGVGLRAEGNLGRWRTMRDLGDDLVAEIRRRFPDDSYDIAGYSFGASMAFETVRLMEERGFPVHRLYLIAPMPFDFYSAGPLRLQLDGLRRPVRELSGREILGLYARSNNPLTRRPYRRAWRWLAIEPWRRLLCGIGRLRRLAGLPLTDRILYADVRVDRFRLHATYRPGTIQTPTVIFNAAEPATDAAATWRPFFDGPLTVHDIPDPHLGEESAERARREILRHLSNLGNP